MSDPTYYIGSVVMSAGTYVPTGGADWMECNGQLLPVNQYTALFSIIGTTYGGDGYRNFALPDYKKRFPLGQSPNLHMGPSFGSSEMTIPPNALPSHSHTMNVSSSAGSLDSGHGNILAQATCRFSTSLYTPYNEQETVQMYSKALQFSGSNTSMKYAPPYLSVRFFICVDGIYPPRT